MLQGGNLGYKYLIFTQFALQKTVNILKYIRTYAISNKNLLSTQRWRGFKPRQQRMMQKTVNILKYILLKA